MIQRGEFLTSYTPYQAEISQGTLEAIFEFQTLICQLTGQEVANASMYDGSTALTEAVLMAERLTGRHTVLIARTVHPEYRQVLQTYAQASRHHHSRNRIYGLRVKSIAPRWQKNHSQTSPRSSFNRQISSECSKKFRRSPKWPMPAALFWWTESRKQFRSEL